MRVTDKKKLYKVPEMKITFSRLIKDPVIVSSHEDAATVFHTMWDDSLINIQEQFCVIFLNQANHVLGFRVLNTGMRSTSLVDKPLLISLALGCRAASVIIAHNHPSGNLQPSIADRELTQDIKRKCEFFDIKLLDHFIITSDGHYSFAINNIL
ncbi:JAB domain-containing protein [Weeksella virosa]|uniref:DNA repair protein RadC n=1 Tax=Weeksella virosa (strain ATCC 43766 / DSM 16922 / JCM 21250 / CCUG 30538 / CDC 9751 / IAM 14551 / NBRC 16016 / NCTC 11634 / CL345/78) TaxID=865938 RepID=F0P2W1_WEEVC|nr:JAB domain-containing protein [Weeksella virosa]ADX66851.1 DNA repair protein RadC [Weeksella virosa DSM 16922]MDK7675088.1 JAB domain-containing protein [Weeksella virosa]VEH63425.1 DNA repair protein RadC [Weeksella virosa]